MNFQSLEDLADILEQLGLQLHAKNRIAAGESAYHWHLAEIIRKAGRLASLATRDRVLFESFGDGYEGGSIREEKKEARFLELLKRV